MSITEEEGNQIFRYIFFNFVLIFTNKISLFFFKYFKSFLLCI